MERHDYIYKMFRQQEFSQKLEVTLNKRMKGYEDEIIEDMVYYQAQNSKDRLGQVNVFAIKGKSILVNGTGRHKKNTQM